MNKIIRLLIPIMLFGIMNVSCGNTAQEKEDAKMAEQERIEAQKRVEEEQRIAEERRMEEQRLAEERRQEELQKQKEKKILDWLQGNWEWSGYIGNTRYSFRLGISDDYAVLATPRGVYDQGRITIDMDDNTFSFGNTYFDFDYENGRMGVFSDGSYYTKY